MSVKLIDIARLAGVSKATASRALHGSPLVKEETKLLVMEKAKELKYKPNALAQAMATKKSGIIGFLMYKKDPPYVGHTFFGPLLDGALEAATNQNFHIVLAVANDMEDTFDEHFIQDSIDGALLVSFHPTEVIREFERRGIPLVVINDYVESNNNAFVVDDNYGGACAIMEHLIKDRGHKKIAHITEYFAHRSYRARYQAYLDIHAMYKIPVFNGLVSVNITSFQNGVKAMNELLSRDDLPTAVFATTDSLAIGAIHAIQSAGLRVPEDIAVAGYDDIEAALMSNPTLTTICVDRDRIGREAVAALAEQIAEPEKASRLITIKNKLIVRGST